MTCVLLDEKWYSAINQEYALVKAIIREFLYDAVQMKRIRMIARRKQVNFPSCSWYEVTCVLKDQGKLANE